MMNRLKDEILGYLRKSVNAGDIPGGVIIIFYQGHTLLYEAFGWKRLSPHKEEMTFDTIFDLASLTKVVATWPAILYLAGAGTINLEASISAYLPIPNSSPLNIITVLNLLKHTAGLPLRTYLKQYGIRNQEIFHGLYNSELEFEPDTRVAYCNRGFILLGKIIEYASGTSLDNFVRDKIWFPLGMQDTCYNPPASIQHRIAPTEYRSELGACQQGVVHDENAQLLEGVAGHAGVFSTVDDLATFCQTILANGTHNHACILKPNLIKLSFRNQTEGLNEARGIAWARYRSSPPIYGHLGFTGTSIWISPATETFAILLTNRVHPTRANVDGIVQVRQYVLQQLSDLIE